MRKKEREREGGNEVRSQNARIDPGLSTKLENQERD
jgi:hypothetical protein